MALNDLMRELKNFTTHGKMKNKKSIKLTDNCQFQLIMIFSSMVFVSNRCKLIKMKIDMLKKISHFMSFFYYYMREIKQ